MNSSFAPRIVHWRGGRLLAFAFVLALEATLSSRADNPGRFLSVTNWYVTLTHSLTENGSFDYTDISGCAVTTDWKYNHAVTASFQLVPDPQFPVNPYIGRFIWKTDNSSTVTINDQFNQTTTCSATVVLHYSVTVNNTTQPPTTTNVVLLVNALGPSYDIDVSGLDIPVSTQIISDGNGTPGPDTLRWAPEFHFTNSLPTTGLVLQGTKSYPMSQWYSDITPAAPFFNSSSPLTPALFSQSLELNWNLTPEVEQLEVVVDAADYQTWLPEGDLKDWTKHGNFIYFTATLQTTNGGVPVSRATNFTFELLNVSQEPGVCLNRPHQEFANTSADLRFETNLNQSPFVAVPLQVQNGGITAVTAAPGEYLSAVAGVSSFDFGSYGEFKVTAEVNGQQIVGYWRNDPAKQPKPLLLPRRQPSSKIADQWKEDNGVTDLGDDDDSENDPVGDGDKGDGFTLYEEYRGFSENLNHIRLDPKRKDFFVTDRIKTADSMQGLALFTAQTGLNVHSQMRPEEFHAALGANGELFDTLVNFNHSGDTPHRVDQHGIAILEKPSSDGTSYAGPNPKIDNRGQGGTPGRYLTVTIDPAFYGWQDVRSSDGTKVLTFQGPAAVAHELTHTCAVWHHGDSDRLVTWQLNNSTIFENTLSIIPLSESGSPFPVLFISGAGVTNWIGMPHGQHSGVADCYMRYFTANAYPSTNDIHVRYCVDEVTGIGLCSTNKGDGINAPGHVPQPRYFDAALNRGNCKAQICVCDTYNDNGNHKR